MAVGAAQDRVRSIGVAVGPAYNGRTVSEAKDTFYITSAIYYANDLPHVGHTYEIVA